MMRRKNLKNLALQITSSRDEESWRIYIHTHMINTHRWTHISHTHISHTHIPHTQMETHTDGNRDTQTHT